MKNRVQPSPNNQSKGALREWSGNSEHSAIGSNYQILSTPVQHRCSDFRPCCWEKRMAGRGGRDRTKSGLKRPSASALHSLIGSPALSLALNLHAWRLIRADERFGACRRNQRTTCFKLLDQCCPIKSRIDSTGCRVRHL